jgi:hypothetical protein
MDGQPQAPKKSKLGTPAILAIACLGLVLVCACACIVVALLAPSFVRNLGLPGLEGALEQYLPSMSAGPSDSGTGGAIELQEGLASGALALEAIGATQSQPFGPIVGIEVTNYLDEVVRVAVPCGTILLPQDPDQQRLMVVQPAVIPVAPGETADLTAYVVCIDSDKAVPEAGSAYDLGQPAQATLAKFAACVCGEDLNRSLSPLAGWDVQLAAWMVADDATLDDLLGQGADASGALGELFGGEFGQQMQGMLDLLTKPAQEWLDRCQVRPGG